MDMTSTEREAYLYNLCMQIYRYYKITELN